jgi:hypothetical protein
MPADHYCKLPPDEDNAASFRCSKCGLKYVRSQRLGGCLAPFFWLFLWGEVVHPLPAEQRWEPLRHDSDASVNRESLGWAEGGRHSTRLALNVLGSVMLAIIVVAAFTP